MNSIYLSLYNALVWACIALVLIQGFNYVFGTEVSWLEDVRSKAERLLMYLVVIPFFYKKLFGYIDSAAEQGKG